MKFLNEIFKNLPEYKKLLNAYNTSFIANATTGLSNVHKANLISAMHSELGNHSLVLVSDEGEAQRLANDISAMGNRVFVYPLRDFVFRDVEGKSREYEHLRLKVLSHMATGDYDTVIACVDAAAQYTLPVNELKTATVKIKYGEQLSPDDIIKVLLINGYEQADQVEGTGQFAHRGGILDLFMPDAPAPVRIEFWSDEIDTINYFDVETQRRTDYVEEITVMPSNEVLLKDPIALAEKIEHKIKLLKSKNTAAAEILKNEADSLRQGIRIGSTDKFISLIYNGATTLFDYIDENTTVYVSEQARIKERLKGYNWQFEENLKDYFSEGILCRGFETYSIGWNDILCSLRAHKTVFLDTFTHAGYDLPLNELVSFTTKQLSPWSGGIKLLCEDLENISSDKNACVVLAGTQKAAKTVAEDICQQGYNAIYCEDIAELHTGIVYVMGGCLSGGLEYPQLKFSLITYSQQSALPVKRKKAPKNSKQVYSLSELVQGDYVVHSTHGIGIYRGIHKIDMQGVVKDYIKVEYAKDDVLYVPVTQLDLVSKYIGPKEDSSVKLNRLGGTEWQKTKTRVRSAVKDMAKELIKLYSERMNAPGFAFGSDDEWQRDFEAKFEYEETADQIRCTDEIKHDMQRTAPMDRLLCGDVGFGKTEVALRAAFKCVTNSKQCALLVPTTILAWQHYQTVVKRFEGYPIRVELLSRFRTPKQQADIIQRLHRGEIDMIIGTHRLVQKDVLFRDLGLVIIDEEQRFGVAQKERFKELFNNVDVLTLSATPIPRTLNMAMSGIRDMSVLEEAPLDRQPVQTYVLEHDNAVIAEAIRRELRRGGQVFYLHNKVESIERRAAAIQAQIPEARVGFGHGKMSESELSEVWRKMLEQEINVLVCTTIIETGVDLPNANTLIIENADHMGLSQLHQIRGRVGRSSRRAYAYLTFMPNKVLTEISQKRLTAIREFTEFGSGFKIAMRDLELRGAGNILGAQQHGHMEDVGYDMYLKLLGEAVALEKGEKPESADLECLVDIQVQAHIPEDYIESLSQRLDVYRRISDIRGKADADDVLDEIIDRFGEPPKAVLGLIEVAMIRNTASQMGIYEIKQNGTAVNLFVNDIKSEAVVDIITRNKGRAMLSAGSKPYISIKTASGADIIKIINEVLYKN